MFQGKLTVKLSLPKPKAMPMEEESSEGEESEDDDNLEESEKPAVAANQKMGKEFNGDEQTVVLIRVAAALEPVAAALVTEENGEVEGAGEEASEEEVEAAEEDEWSNGETGYDYSIIDGVLIWGAETPFPYLCVRKRERRISGSISAEEQ